MRFHRSICAFLGVVLLSGCPKEEGPPPHVPEPGGTLRTYVLVIDGLMPETISPAHTPALCRIAPCAGTRHANGPSRATVYAQARAVMLTQTNANHVAMMTGAYGDVSGAIGNAFYDRRAGEIKALVAPQMILVPTVFDVLGEHGVRPQTLVPDRTDSAGASVGTKIGGQTPTQVRAEQAPMKTAVVVGKEKLRWLFGCTMAHGLCAPSSDNPEGVSIAHVRPNFLKGSASKRASGLGDCQAEPAQWYGVARDECIIDAAIKLIGYEDPAILLINLGKVDYLQHQFGPGSPEALAAVKEADKQVGKLVQHLRKSGKWESTVLFVLSDHSFSNQGKPPAHRIDLDALLQADRKDNPVAWGTNGGLEEAFVVMNAGGAAMLTLKSITGKAQTLNTAQADALKRMREVALLAKPGVRRAGVSEALYRLPNPEDPGNTVDAVHPDWHLDTARVGDLIVTVLASGPGTPGDSPQGTGQSPSAPTSGPSFKGGNAYEVKEGFGYAFAGKGSFAEQAIGNHGHPGARHIPFIIASGGDFVIDQVIAASDPAAVNEGDDTAALPEQAEVVDVAPTILWLQGLLAADAEDAKAVLPQSEGRVLREAFKEGWVP